jgi:tetratricopeptide (TPR) repeat protein
MNTKKSIVSDASVGIENESTRPNDVIIHRRTNIRMPLNTLFAWLDKSINNNNEDCQNNIQKLKCLVHSVETFTDRDQCVDFLTDNGDKKVFLIVSGTFCRNMVPLICDISHLHTIFILCRNKTKDEQWVKQWPKIRGVFTDISSICDVLKDTAQRCEQNDISISFVPTTSDAPTKVLDRLDPAFMYSQILKEIFLTISFEEKHRQDFLEFCRKVFNGDQKKLRNAERFIKEYRDQTPIYWYTWDSFLYPMLNHALRTMNVDITIQIGFFVADLHRHIERLHSQQFREPRSRQSFTVYRGQGLSKADFELLTKTKGGLISFNNFLSTSTNRYFSLLFADCSRGDPDLVGILFVMTIDSSKSTAPFASVADVACLGAAEEEVLFSMHTVFRICNIQPISDNEHIFQVDLELTNDDDKDLRTLTDRIREETVPQQEGWARLGLLLLKMGNSDKAQQVYDVLLSQTKTNSRKVAYYDQIGWTKFNQGAYQEAITFFETVLTILQHSLPANHPYLATPYINIGNAYLKIGECFKALSSHEKALAILQQSFPSNHPNLAVAYTSIGIVYSEMGEHSKALSCHETSLAIQQQSLPSNDPYLAASYNNIGKAYSDRENYPKALSFHEKALVIQQQSLPSNHPDLATSYNNMGSAYLNMGEYFRALSFYEKTLELQQQSLPSNHPDLIASHHNIGNVYCDMEQYSKALSSYEKALVMRQQSLPSNHPDLATSYNDIGVVHERMGECLKACSFYERAVSIGQVPSPLNNPIFQTSKRNLNRMKTKLISLSLYGVR